MDRIKEKIDFIHNEHLKKDLTIIHIADIHFSTNTKYQKLQKIKDKIISEKPDYLVITGDLIDYPNITKNKTKIKELINFLIELGLHTKVLISLGNHDICCNSDYTFFRKLNDLKNIQVLDNKSYQDEFIYIAGLTLPSNYYYNIKHQESVEVLLEHLKTHEDLISKLPSNIPKVLLIHSPIKLTDTLVIDKLHEYDVMLSGHTHNGMVPDFLNKFFKQNMGIISPNKKFFPEIAKGKIEKKYKNKKITIIINGGITKLSLRSSKLLSKLNFIYNISINKIIITKKRGNFYE